MRRQHLPSGTNQGHGRLQQDHRAHQVGHIVEHRNPADHGPAAGHDSPVADAPRIADSGHGILAAGVRAEGKENGRGSGHSLGGPADTGLGEERRSPAEGLDHRDRAKVQRRGSTRTSAAEVMGFAQRY
jgi:hypothetical protein